MKLARISEIAESCSVNKFLFYQFIGVLNEFSDWQNLSDPRIHGAPTYLRLTWPAATLEVRYSAFFVTPKDGRTEAYSHVNAAAKALRKLLVASQPVKRDKGNTEVLPRLFITLVRSEIIGASDQYLMAVQNAYLDPEPAVEAVNKLNKDIIAARRFRMDRLLGNTDTPAVACDLPDRAVPSMVNMAVFGKVESGTEVTLAFVQGSAHILFICLKDEVPDYQKAFFAAQDAYLQESSKAKPETIAPTYQLVRSITLSPITVV